MPAIVVGICMGTIWKLRVDGFGSELSFEWYLHVTQNRVRGSIAWNQGAWIFARLAHACVRSFSMATPP